jgi:predicted flap endonuclease-1-like 5' DNA nuclease
MPEPESDLPSIGAPAWEALRLEGYTRLEQLNGVSESALARIHGVGPKVLRILREALAEKGWAFSDLPKLAALALRALHGAGYTRLEQLNGVSEADLKALHGMGPHALKTLREALAAKGWTFKD